MKIEGQTAAILPSVLLGLILLFFFCFGAVFSKVMIFIFVYKSSQPLSRKEGTSVRATENPCGINCMGTLLNQDQAGGNLALSLPGD